MAVVGKYTWLIATPDSYRTSPSGMSTGSRAGSQRAHSSGGSAASRWFLRGSECVAMAAPTGMQRSCGTARQPHARSGSRTRIVRFPHPWAARPCSRGECSAQGVRAKQILQQLQLLALHRQQFAPLPFPQLVQLVMQQHDLEFGLQIDFVVVKRATASAARAPRVDLAPSSWATFLAMWRRPAMWRATRWVCSSSEE